MKKNMITLREPFIEGYSMTEAYTTLRSNLMFCGSEHKVIGLSSCTPGEGKSTVSLHLARSFAEGGKRALLVDADMRKSVMFSEYAEGTHTLGLSHCLSGQATFEEAVVSTQYPDLDIMFSGTYPPNPVKLLDGEAFSALIARARKEYDYVIIDLPPIGLVIDAAVAAKNCDGILMVVAAEKNSVRFAQSCLRQLEKSGTPILGSVLTMTNPRTGRRYKRYSGRYYGHEQN
jgi:capsular exopolysaccharide synthesis family protein